MFFRIAIAAGLISRERKSNYIDIAYLCYLPFCNIFVSSDKLQIKCAPLFMNKNQIFISGNDLKQGLSQINSHYSSLPIDVKEKGLMHFAATPPKDEGFLITKIWDKVFQNWRTRFIPNQEKTIQSLNEKKLGEKITKAFDSPTLLPDEIDFNPYDPDTITLKRLVYGKKGSWYQLPKSG